MGLLDQLSSWLGRPRPGTEVTILVLGLDNSGKTTLLQALRAGESPSTPTGASAGGAVQPVVPTVAEQQSHFQSGGVSFSAWDVSGAARLRPLWERHYRRANAIVYVVDAADHLRLVVAREELHLTLSHADVVGRRLPLLVFANKSDAAGALAPHHLATALGLEGVTDKPWHVCASSAISGAGVRDGIAWLARQLRDAQKQRPDHA